MSNNRSVQNIASLTGRFFITVVLLLSVILGLYPAKVAANPYPKLLNRSLLIDTSEPGATTDYTMSWRLTNSVAVGSVRLLLCADPYVLDPCSATPPGDFSGASLASQTGAVTGFSIMSQTANEVILTRTPGSVGTSQSTYVLSDVINPTGLSGTFFIQVFVYASNNATGTPNHISSLANSTAEPIMITTEVPPILYFCAALTIDTWCENVNGNHIDYGDLTPALEDAAISQFGVATNALGGYAVTVNGDTMTAGNKIIDALSVPTANTPGTAQFGLNLRANTSPAIGQDVSGIGIGTVTTDYDTPDLFKYADGDMVASSATGTMFNTFTVTYIVNVPANQPSGVYNTTIAYICTAAF